MSGRNRRNGRSVILAAALLIIAVLLSGCSMFSGAGSDAGFSSSAGSASSAASSASSAAPEQSGRGNEVGKENVDILGHWVDVNSDTTLDIDNEKVKYKFGNWTETFKYKISKTSWAITIEPAEEESFGMMSPISVNDDGSLSAQDLVLDAEGHHYRFVREENKKSELEIQDLSEDLPKSIESRDLEEFSLSFSLGGPGMYGLDESWPSGYYYWTIEKNDDGTLEMVVDISGDSYIILQYSETVDKAFAEGLADLLESSGAVKQNGYYKKNNASARGWLLTAEYASGDELMLRAEGDASREMPFDLNALMEYAKQAGVEPKW